MPGFPTAIVKNHSIQEKFLCGFCVLILKEPRQTYCGHRYCKTCFDLIISRSDDPKCKACIEEGVSDSILSSSEAYPDRAIVRELNELQVNCVNDGCDWQGLYKEYKEHETHCPYEQILCIRTGCGKRVIRERLAEHLEKECPLRQVACQYCASEFAFKDIKGHHKECPEYPICCKYCNEENIPRAKVRGKESNLEC